MSRSARIKEENGTYHIMMKSLPELELHKNNSEKNKLLEYIKKYQIKFQFKVRAYCLMDNHTHLLIYTNGADLSQFMHDINQSYAQYFNRIHKRKGHVLYDRFKSIPINTEKYLFTVSAYIHNNPRAIKKYREKVEEYKYSSLGVYIGLRNDPFNIVDEEFILKMFSKDINKARKAYLEFVYQCDDKVMKKITEFENEKSEYRSEEEDLNRGFTPEEILNFVSKYTGMPTWQILLKNSRSNTREKALFILMLKCLCNFKDKDICKYIGNITQSRVSSLCSTGIELVMNNDKYKSIIEDFIKFKNDCILTN